ncbi:hypothetical protein CCR75_009062 [Bremia lactucae]|uniref:Uncharacterized protein n=1 Tax=Bremia lactucae TaxID=4779 RepID=A0A976IHF5_BRELC|nr:hypothetical protein CCR75_009062 [Bremia lactucae]
MCIPIPCGDDICWCLCGALTACCCCRGSGSRRHRRSAPRERVVYVQPVVVQKGPPRRHGRYH